MITKKRKESDASPGVIATTVVVPIILLVSGSVLVVVILVWYYRQHKKTITVEFTIDMMAEQYEASNPLFDRVQTSKPPGPHEKEFPSEKIKFVRELGEGAFGRVYQGMATNIIKEEDSTIVAVKQLKTDNTDDINTVVVEFFKGEYIFEINSTMSTVLHENSIHPQIFCIIKGYNKTCP